MNLAIAYPQQQEEELPVMKVIRNEERIFETRYLRGLNLVTVKGWSIAKDIYTKYEELLTNIESHFETSSSLNVHFKYELFNSSSLKYLFRIIKAMNTAHADGNRVKIYWSCNSDNDSEMIDMGLDLANISDFKFDISYL